MGRELERGSPRVGVQFMARRSKATSHTAWALFGVLLLSPTWGCGSTSSPASNASAGSGSGAGPVTAMGGDSGAGAAGALSGGSGAGGVTGASGFAGSSPNASGSLGFDPAVLD